MCYNIEIYLTRDQIKKRFNVEVPDKAPFRPSYYVSAFDLPLHPVISNENSESVRFYQWGLIPYWVNDQDAADDIRYKTLNARMESLNKKPSYKNAFDKHRCLILAHGFFEWRHINSKKIPYYIKRKDDQPFAIAGLYDVWENPVTNELQKTFSLITTKASPMMEKIHNTKKRMPFMLDQNTEREWIAEHDNEEVFDAVSLIPDDKLYAHPVSTKVSKRDTNKNTPDILEPFDEYPELKNNTLF
jgi:putative SOS response-associated peptidase YedK